MLKIILGCKDEEKYLKNKKYVDYNDGLFDDEYEEEAEANYINTLIRNNS